jgi:5-oxoprolinase (ATP-hydrolysing) subunit A
VEERIVDLNADLGEEITDDSGLLAVVTSANVACGYHAGNVSIMRRVCAEAVRQGVSIGAQVSYADRPNFGRLPVEVSPEVLADQVADQIGTLTEVARAEGAAVRYVKPHGALYHRVIDDEAQASAVLAGSPTLPILGFPNGVLLRTARAAGRTTFTEAFPDRSYAPDGRLRPRASVGALITDPVTVAERALEWAPQVDSVCVHGDSPGAVATAVAVRRALRSHDWMLRCL